MFLSVDIWLRVDCHNQGLCVINFNFINSWWPRDSIMWNRSGSTLISGNGLLPDGTKPIPEPMLTNHQWILLAISREILKTSLLDIILKMTNLRKIPKLPGAIELMITNAEGFHYNLVQYNVILHWTWQFRIVMVQIISNCKLIKYTPNLPLKVENVNIYEKSAHVITDLLCT